MDKYESLETCREWKICFELLKQDDISEIHANGPGQFFYKRKGIMQRVEGIPNMSLARYHKGIAVSLARFVSSEEPFSPTNYLFEGALDYHEDKMTGGDGSSFKGRCHIVARPASRCAQVTIAKKNQSLVTLESIASSGSMSFEMMNFINAIAASRMTFAISGSTGAGKTTMLEAITKKLPDDERIGVAEDIPELILRQPNVSYLNAVPWRPGLDPNKVATLSWCVRQFQRMRIDRVLIGEVRGPEFSDFLTAANSGMEGSMITIHADNPSRCLDKMTAFALDGSPGQSIKLVNQDIANTLDFIIQLTRTAQGKYRVLSIAEITNTVGDEANGYKISTNELYSYDKTKDIFVKKNSMLVSDRNRQKFIEKGIDIVSIMSTRTNIPMEPMSGNIKQNAKTRDVHGRGVGGRTLPRFDELDD